MYAIVCDGDVVGMIRMARRDEPDTMETGMWLGESARGTATHRLVGRGCGSLEKRVLAIGIDHNVPPAVALAAARDGLDCAGISTKSTVGLDISVKPWEQIYTELHGRITRRIAARDS
jgi:hypothetical protein